jgi:glycosyltransferase involved in cell wall biosynthesis
MKKLLMISYQFPPDVGSIQRILNYVKYLPEYGWQPVVLTHKDDVDLCKKIDDQFLTNNVKVIRCGRKFSIRNLLFRRSKTNTNINSSEGNNKKTQTLIGKLFFYIKQVIRKVFYFIYWPDVFITWVPSAIKNAKRIIKSENIDIVYIVTPPHSSSIIGFFLKGMPNVKVLLDFRDPWANDVDLISPTFIHRSAHKFAEKKVINKCDAITTTTQAHSDYFKKTVIKTETQKVHTITNGVDIQSYKPKYTDLYPSFTITYTGNFDSTRQPDPLLKAVANIRKNSPHVFGSEAIKFFGVYNIFLDEKAKTYGLTNIIKQYGIIEFNDVINEMSRASILLLVVHNDPVTPKFCIPAKLFEYIASGRPILAITPPGAAYDIILKYNLGKAFAHEDTKGIEKAIMEYYDLFSQGKLLTNIPKPDILNKFDRKHLTGDLAKILESI